MQEARDEACGDFKWTSEHVEPSEEKPEPRHNFSYSIEYLLKKDPPSKPELNLTKDHNSVAEFHVEPKIFNGTTWSEGDFSTHTAFFTLVPQRLGYSFPRSTPTPQSKCVRNLTSVWCAAKLLASPPTLSHTPGNIQASSPSPVSRAAGPSRGRWICADIETPSTWRTWDPSTCSTIPGSEDSASRILALFLCTFHIKNTRLLKSNVKKI
ncbi:hypothetical protein HNY73_008398 [Argiope bruennichi]|uniref:Uncharacterized protein n=1 Tax=Argiope bruennichi TaxID=94029 RepID=A0A8T0F6D8_ARGBR|nr:hypothetical protein HNY73_008398 [Argiope bruennichi]